MDDQFDQWQQAEQVSPQRYISNQNNYAKDPTHQKVETTNPINNLETITQNQIETPILITPQPKQQPPQNDNWIFGMNQINVQQQQKPQQQNTIKYQLQTNNYLNFDNIVFQQAKDIKFDTISKSLPNMQLLAQPSLQQKWPQQNLQISSQPQFRPAATSLQNLSFKNVTDHQFVSSNINSLGMYNLAAQNNPQQNNFANIISPTYYLPATDNIKQTTNQANIYTNMKLDNQKEQEWQWQAEGPVTGVAIDNIYNTSAISNNITIQIDHKQQQSNYNVTLNNKLNTQQIQNEAIVSQNQQISQQNSKKQEKQQQEDDQFAWAETPTQNQYKNNQEFNQTVQTKAQVVSDNHIDYNIPQTTIVANDDNQNKPDQQEEDDDQFGDFQGQSKQQTPYIEKVIKPIEPSYTAQDLQAVTNFLNRLPDYSYIQASSFINI